MENNELVYLWSDTHFNHDKEFIYAARGFDNVEDHNEFVYEGLKTVPADAHLYLLGDIMLGKDKEAGIKYLRSIPCANVHIILGNHDTDAKQEYYAASWNVVEMVYATRFKYNGWKFYLSHYPTITGNFDDDKSMRNRMYNLCGHTHTFDRFEGMVHNSYNVGVEAHKAPILLTDIIEDIRGYYGN